jgi:hypothetical protein
LSVEPAANCTSSSAADPTQRECTQIPDVLGQVVHVPLSHPYCCQLEEYGRFSCFASRAGALAEGECDLVDCSSEWTE